MDGNSKCHTIREATSKDKDRVVELLSQAFDKNLSVNFVVRNGKKRKHRIKNLMDYSFEMGVRFGKVFVSNDLNSTCILIFPERKKVRVSTILLDMKLIFSVIGIRKLPKVLHRERLVYRNHANKPYIHLWYIGVDPNFQNQGLGSRMMDMILSEYVKPVYLETSTISNLPFYEKYGFCVQQKINLEYDLYCLNNQK